MKTEKWILMLLGFCAGSLLTISLNVAKILAVLEKWKP